MPRLDIRAVDVAFVAILLGASSTIYTNWRTGGYYAIAAAIAPVIAAFVVVWQSLFTCEWISTYHLTHYDARKDTLVRPQRKAGNDIPCPYPDAWYAVGFAEEVRPGQVKDIVVCNQNLIVFRPELKPGQTAWPPAAVLDAYCTHLGAHLALGGGRVEGDCVRCPFHGWCFDSTGALQSTASGDCPPGSDLRSWPVLEKNGVIAVWMSSTLHKSPAILRQTIRPVRRAEGGSQGSKPESATGGAGAPGRHGKEDRSAAEVTSMASNAAAITDNTPWFTIPAVLEGQDFVYHGFTENTVNSVLWENPENGADVAHLNALHAEFILPSLYPFLSHSWAATWNVREPTPEIADMTVKENIILAKRVTMPGEVNVHITQCGPSQVFIDMTTPVGRVIVVECVTPVNPRCQRVLHALYAHPMVPRVFAKAILYSVIVQYEKDVPIWCNKVYAPKPMLAKHDPAIPAYRRWRKQFIQDGAITFTEAVKAHVADTLGLPAETGLDW